MRQTLNRRGLSQFRRRLAEVHQWSNPEVVELMTDSALIIWGLLLWLPGDGLASIAPLAFLSNYVPDVALGSVLIVAGVVQQWVSLWRIRPWRRLLLLVGLFWWVFLAAAIVLSRGLTPSLGTYIPLVCGCFWAQIRIGTYELEHDRMARYAKAMRGGE
jgi:hypothetical protein